MKIPVLEVRDVCLQFEMPFLSLLEDLHQQQDVSVRRVHQLEVDLAADGRLEIIKHCDHLIYRECVVRQTLQHKHWKYHI